ncbi:transmembrane protein, putative (macronuclear) [Tetrahymena thermophila SB210]|uniref:Transmembrane protein, putative n=1 Tax=Tetrahymena thermophila (strain SB210) TaxID=312017 RepID=W7XDD9_TETTS|nr:transmembrane protein, putative [Tetrahymena thermophila SB210]EWS71826.1 transmembrane protein, putative [Tetrahymena thermophila SB210]|eukprot:XP_012655648.1 transmembrane protein, putative [Tetrahymena thermophila SB210]
MTLQQNRQKNYIYKRKLICKQSCQDNLKILTQNEKYLYVCMHVCKYGLIDHKTCLNKFKFFNKIQIILIFIVLIDIYKQLQIILNSKQSFIMLLKCSNYLTNIFHFYKPFLSFIYILFIYLLFDHIVSCCMYRIQQIIKVL